MKNYVFDPANQKTQYEVLINFTRLKQLFDTGLIQNPRNFRDNPFYLSVFFDMIIMIDDLCQKIKGTNRISFKDDIPQNEDLQGEGFNDITDFVRYTRNAVCHIDNDKRNIGLLTISFGMINGAGPAMLIGNTPLFGKYSDDGCIVFGNKQFYIKRHLIRVYEELTTAYLNIPEFKLNRIFSK